jgi:peroxiredoxin
VNSSFFKRIRVAAFAVAAGLLICFAATAPPRVFSAEPFSDMGIIRPQKLVTPPGFELKSINGSTFSLSELKGKVVIINFWSTNCAPCKAEMPSLERLWQRLRGKGLIVVAVSVDKKRERKIKKFAKKHKLTFPIILDKNASVRKSYEVVALPTSYIIGRDGSFIGKVIGEKVWDSEASVRLFEELLKD